MKITFIILAILVAFSLAWTLTDSTPEKDHSLITIPTVIKEPIITKPKIAPLKVAEEVPVKVNEEVADALRVADLIGKAKTSEEMLEVLVKNGLVKTEYPAEVTELVNFINDNEIRAYRIGKRGVKLTESDLKDVMFIRLKPEQSHLLTNDTIQKFKLMKRLSSIRFTGKGEADISDIDFDYLVETLPKLRTLDLTNTNIKKTKLAELRAKFGSVHFVSK